MKIEAGYLSLFLVTVITACNSDSNPKTEDEDLYKQYSKNNKIKEEEPINGKLKWVSN